MCVSFVWQYHTDLSMFRFTSTISKYNMIRGAGVLKSSTGRRTGRLFGPFGVSLNSYHCRWWVYLDSETVLLSWCCFQSPTFTHMRFEYGLSLICLCSLPAITVVALLWISKFQPKDKPQEAQLDHCRYCCFLPHPVLMVHGRLPHSVSSS